MSDHTLSTDFWNEFRGKHWEKYPGTFKGLFDTPFITPARMFDAIIGMPSYEASDRFWAADTDTPTKRADFQETPLATHGPRREDQSLKGFFSRVHKQMGGRQVGLNLHGLEKSQPEIWFQFRKFIHDLNKITGEFPSDQWDIDAFLGTYKSTPLCIHQDNASVFAIGVMGHRTYHTWPDDYFKKGDAALSTLDMKILQPHLDQATSMELGPGDLVYWPSSNWHFVTSDGQPSAIISVSAYFGKNLSEVISNHVKHLVAGQLKQNDHNLVYTLNQKINEPPRQMADAYKLFETTVRDGHLANALHVRWLTMCSADGLHPVLPETETSLGMQDIISVDPRFPVVWGQMQNKGLCIAANGLTFSLAVTHNSAILKMLEQLNTGQSFVASELAGEHTQGDVTADLNFKILSTLQRFRAFRKNQV